MSSPIPIYTTPPHPSHAGQGNMTSTTPSSTLSISPQTPFSPPQNLATSPSPQTQPGLFKWASTFSKSPTHNAPGNSNSTTTTTPMPLPEVFRPEEHEHEAHDSFEFGDMSDLRSRSWATSRRAVSVSGSSGISSLLKGFGATSPTASTPLTAGNSIAQQSEMTPASVPAPGPGVMADKVAKGQGVLRRFSMSGVGFTRPPFMSPPNPAAPLPADTAPTTAPPIAPPIEPPTADPTVQRANTVSGARGRRYSETTKKRGVSPMGERILREHGHF